VSLCRHLPLVMLVRHNVCHSLSCRLHPWDICSFLTFRPIFLRSCASLPCHLSPLTCFYVTGLSHSHAWFSLVCRQSRLIGLLSLPCRFSRVTYYLVLDLSPAMFDRLSSVTCHQRHECISLVRPLFLLKCFLVLARPWPFACESWHVVCVPSQFFSSLTSRLLSLICLRLRSFFLVAPDVFACSFLVVCNLWHFGVSLVNLSPTLTATDPWRVALSPLICLVVHDLSSMAFLWVSASLDIFVIYRQYFTAPISCLFSVIEYNM
jgi:hypothetical protein